MQRTLYRCLHGGLRAKHLRFAEPVVFPHKACRKPGGRIVVDSLRRGILLHITAIQNSNTVAHTHGLRLVVGHENGGDAERGGQVRQLVPHFLPKQSVQSGERLIEQNTPRPDGYGAGERNALLLPAGELMGIPLFKVLQMHGAQRVTNSVLQICCIFSCPQAEGHIFKHRHLRPERKVLKHKAEIPLLRRQADLAFLGKNAGIVQPDLAVIWRLQSGNHPQQRRLSATGWTQSVVKLPFRMVSVVGWMTCLLSKLFEIWFNRISIAVLFSTFIIKLSIKAKCKLCGLNCVKYR